MEDLVSDIQNVITKIDLIIENDDFKAYSELKNCYEEALQIISKGGSKEDVKNTIKFTIRMLQEAPPQNRELGMDTLIAMDKVFKKLSTTII